METVAFLRGMMVRMDTLDNHVIAFELQTEHRNQRYRVDCGRGISQYDLHFSEGVMVSGKESDGVITPSRVWNTTRNICYQEEQLFPKRSETSMQHYFLKIY